MLYRRLLSGWVLGAWSDTSSLRITISVQLSLALILFISLGPNTHLTARPCNVARANAVSQNGRAPLTRKAPTLNLRVTPDQPPTGNHLRNHKFKKCRYNQLVIYMGDRICVGGDPMESSPPVFRAGNLGGNKRGSLVESSRQPVGQLGSLPWGPTVGQPVGQPVGQLGHCHAHT